MGAHAFKFYCWLLFSVSTAPSLYTCDLAVRTPSGNREAYAIILLLLFFDELQLKNLDADSR